MNQLVDECNEQIRNQIAGSHFVLHFFFSFQFFIRLQIHLDTLRHVIVLRYAFVIHKICLSENKVNFAFVIRHSIYLLITMATASFSTLSPNTSAYKLTSTCKALNIASIVSGSYESNNKNRINHKTTVV